MKLHFTKKNYRWSILLSIVFLATYGGSILLSTYIESKIKSRIYSSRGKVSSIEVNLFARSVRFKNAEWSSVLNDTSQAVNSLNFRTISVEGIGLYELLIHKKLLINDLVLDSGTIRYNGSIKRKSPRIPDSKYNFFAFKNISLNNIYSEVKSDTIVRFSGIVNCRLGNALIKVDSLHNLSYCVNTMDALLEKINIGRVGEMYGATVARLAFNSNEQRLVIDSAVLIPHFDKYEFAQHRGEQVARIDLSIPQLTIEGLLFSEMMDSSLVASKIAIKSFNLFAFKDKRIPFRRRENVPLPMAWFLKLPFRVNIDSIAISDSHITVEEFPEHGIKTGTITFANINATIAKLNNRQVKNNHTYSTLNASCLLMGSGKVKALFQFPLDGTSNYTAVGSISDLPFQELNPVLTAMANVRVKSGYLKNLTFDFKYNEFTSKGNVNIDYEDLHLTGLNTNKRSTNEVKTFLINAFVKNNRSKSATPAIKNGVIDIERDRKRYVFNVWLRSILDGLKSAILK